MIADCRFGAVKWTPARARSIAATRHVTRAPSPARNGGRSNRFSGAFTGWLREGGRAAGRCARALTRSSMGCVLAAPGGSFPPACRHRARSIAGSRPGATPASSRGSMKRLSWTALGWLALKDPYQRPFAGQRITKLPDQRVQRIQSNFMTQ